MASAARALGMTLREPLRQVESLGGAALKVTLSDGGISRREIPVRLVYQPNLERTAVRLAWELSIDRVDSSDWWSLRVDATTGELLERNNWTAHADATDAPPADVYRVFPYPFESPTNTTHQPGHRARPIRSLRPSAGTTPTATTRPTSPTPAATTSSPRTTATTTTPAAAGRPAPAPVP